MTHFSLQNCLISDIGTVEKQVAGVFISKSRNIVGPAYFKIAIDAGSLTSSLALRTP